MRTPRCQPLTFVGIILTYRCTSACRHCLYACSPARRETMEHATLERTVAALAALPHPPSVHLAGGEAFLEPDLLVRATEVVTRAGLEMDFIETNAAWLRHDDDARALLQRLADAGAPRLLISATPFHAETIPLSRVERLYRLAEQVFGPRGAVLWTHDFYAQLSAIERGGRVSFDRYLGTVGPAAAALSVLHRFPMTVAGRAAEGLDGLVRRAPAEHIRSRPCRAELFGTSHAHFDPGGRHLPGYCTGIALGDIEEVARLQSAGLPSEDHPIATLLAEGGVGALLERASVGHGFEPDPEGYRGACHLCQAIRGHLLSGGLHEPELAPRGFYGDLGLL